MTAEERAKGIYRHWSASLANADSGLFDDMIEEFRAAEDEALERAAVLTAPLGHASGATRWDIATMIRAIKSGGAL